MAAGDALPFDQRTAIVLREVDGLSYDEIAFSLGVAVGTVKSRLTRARQTLRAGLREARTACRSSSAKKRGRCSRNITTTNCR